MRPTVQALSMVGIITGCFPKHQDRNNEQTLLPLSSRCRETLEELPTYYEEITAYRDNYGYTVQITYTTQAGENLVVAIVNRIGEQSPTTPRYLVAQAFSLETAIETPFGFISGAGDFCSVDFATDEESISNLWRTSVKNRGGFPPINAFPPEELSTNLNEILVHYALSYGITWRALGYDYASPGSAAEAAQKYLARVGVPEEERYTTAYGVVFPEEVIVPTTAETTWTIYMQDRALVGTAQNPNAIRNFIVTSLYESCDQEFIVPATFPSELPGNMIQTLYPDLSFALTPGFTTGESAYKIGCPDEDIFSRMTQ